MLNIFFIADHGTGMPGSSSSMNADFWTASDYDVMTWKPNGSADCACRARANNVVMKRYDGMSQNLINRALKGLPSGYLAVCELDTIIKSQFLIGKSS